MAVLNLNSATVVELRNLANAVTATPITSATVTLTIVEAVTGNEVGGVNWPLTLPHVSKGTYRGTVLSTAELNKDLSYTGTLVANNGTGQIRTWCIPYTVMCD